MKKKIAYIDGMKGLGCMIVMLGHYYDIFALAESFVPMPKLVVVLGEMGGFFLNSTLGLFFFALISGYCIAMTRIESLGKLVKSIVKRFIRFWIPVLGANLIIYSIYRLIGFYNGDTVQIFQNTWFQAPYQEEYWLGLAVRDSVNTIVGTGARFNSPFWVIRYFFYGSILVYAGNYLEQKCGAKWRYVLYVLEIAAAVWWLSTNGFAIVLGAILCKEQKHPLLEKIKNEKVLAGLTFFCFLLLSSPDFGGAWIRIVLAAVMIYGITQLESLQHFFENRCLTGLGKISFGIYALHWPIICSVSSLMFISIPFQAGIYLVVGVLTVLVVWLLALLYHVTVEKISEWLIWKSKIFQ